MAASKTKRIYHKVDIKNVFDCAVTINWSPDDNNDTLALWDIVKSLIQDID